MPKQRLVVAVDFGMTFTGVAWSCEEDQPPQPLYQDWPGSAPSEVHQKVPTLLVYESSKQGRGRPGSSRGQKLSSWGLLALDDEERYAPDKSIREFFKLFLDEKVLRAQSPEYVSDTSHKDVQHWFQDYLSKIYEHIKSRFTDTRPELWQGPVRFVFSVPTTWSPEVVECFKRIIKKAGFADGSMRGHSAEVTLTEAQAAAVGTAHERKSTLKKGQIILVVDAGGGTTDIALLEVASDENEPLRLEQLDRVDGVAAGSTLIDQDFEDYAVQKLEIINRDHPGKIPDVRTAAKRMAASRKFQTNKCSLSTSSKRLNVPFKIPVDDLARNFSHGPADVERQGLKYDPVSMAALFDARLDKIYQTLDRQFRSMEQLQRTKGRSVKHIVLSGGLGSSSYVKEKLEERYCNKSRPCLRGMTILKATDPQQVVARGLVANEMPCTVSKNEPPSSSLTTKVLQNWISRRSYGIVGMKVFDPNEHLLQDKVGQKDEISQLTGKTWARNQITWVIKSGQKLTTTDCIKIPGVHFIDPDTTPDEEEQWLSRMVASDLDPAKLPHSTSQPGCEPFCVIESDMRRYVDQFDRKKKGWFEKGKTHLVAKYEIRVKIDPADVKFELWYKDQKLSEQRDLRVAWGDGSSLDVFH
ncbi:hypothetical protein G647_01346 [Cladophialophora carrionii CBS 160.54]|uniref:Uncharacterized protein n=1 Tax=Cladophialophora carrionii CBS 160.54 TaxID=1279043 RepID=V9DPR4_9EURO|nr:uncharacterized protein G647_01346 [Cladophialophora carrionii CBS 160.54]ETI28894.1 hypothetical protein G647_01346 [Cladophialophora carrionii CBS 160.54]